MSATDPSVVDHYRSPDLAARLVEALAAAGHEPGALTVEALAGADEFHLGGRRATRAAAEAFDAERVDRLLDVGCGLGGPARTLAAALGCHVTGVDLTEEFVLAARTLSDLVGYGDRTAFEVGDASSLEAADGTFDAATMLHVGMNLADLAAPFGEVARVLRPGGRFVVYDVMRVGAGELTFPLPWATGPETSALKEPDTYVGALEAAGFRVAGTTDRSAMVAEVLARVAADPPPVNLSHVMGPRWPTLFGNLVASLRAGVVAPIEVIAERAP